MDLGLKGRVAIVTGGSDGIGKGAAISMAQEGAHVAIFARGKEMLDAATKEIDAAGDGEVLAVQCDVTDQARVKESVQQVADRFGRIDILVNNAGTSSAAPFEDVTDEMWDADLKLKVWGAIYCSRAAISHMKQAQWGRIINITTPGGKATPGGSMPTSLSRAAGISLTKAMSKDLASDGILVNTVCIGLIKSGQNRRQWERVHANDPSVSLEGWYVQRGEGLPLGRVGEAREAGDLICFLASERASYISGTAVNMDGGSAPVV